MLAAVFLTLGLVPSLALAAEVHGANAEGTVMGPAAFMWPADRPWSADADNIAPCGSTAGPSSRTEFPLGSVGAVSFTIADEAYNIALRIAYGNNPTSQSDFSTLHGNVSTMDAGHQCLPITTPAQVTEGTNGTIQMEYWNTDNGVSESYFACADVTFVPAASFSIAEVPCFNVTSSDFELAAPTSPATTSSTTSAPAPVPEEKGSSGMTAAVKAGIAIAVVGSAIVVFVGAWLVMRRRSKKAQAARSLEAGNPQMVKQRANSISS